jgi:hypothetical protein
MEYGLIICRAKSARVRKPGTFLQSDIFRCSTAQWRRGPVVNALQNPNGYRNSHCHHTEALPSAKKSCAFFFRPSDIAMSLCPCFGLLEKLRGICKPSKWEGPRPAAPSLNFLRLQPQVVHNFSLSVYDRLFSPIPRSFKACLHQMLI